MAPRSTQPQSNDGPRLRRKAAASANNDSAGIPGLRRRPTTPITPSSSNPGVRRQASKQRDVSLPPAVGRVLQMSEVNGIQVRVSAPKAPVHGSERNVIQTQARVKEKLVAPGAKPEGGGASMMVGAPGSVQQLPRRALEPVVSEVVKEAEVEVLAAPKPYWSDKYDAYIEPTDERYSEETARRLGAL